MNKEKDHRQKTEVFDDSNVIGVKIDKHTIIIGRISTQQEQSKPFKPRLYQGKGQSFINLGRGDQYYNNNRNGFYEKTGYLIKVESIIETIRTSEGGTIGIRRKFKDRDRSYDKGRSRNSDYMLSGS